MKILVVSGASGGHIFPALSFLDTLKDKYPGIDTLLILPKKSLENQIITSDYKIRYVSVSNVKLSFNFKNFIAILKFIKGIFEGLLILLEYRADIVVGFGSLVSVPIVLFARIFRIKTLIHEQNVIPGRANRFLTKFTDKIAISFAQTQDYLSNCSCKIIFTGNPIRRQLEKVNKNKALDFFGLSPDKFTLLVMGGSMGSHKINIGFLNAIPMISDKSRIQIIHLSGPKDYAFLRDNYKDLNINIKLFSFLREMQYAYSVTDLVVARAGATTISEIIFFGLPAIIIPYPFAYRHQASNAAVLKNNGCAIVIEDDKLDANILRQNIEDLINNPDKIKKMRSQYNNLLKTNANDLLVKEAVSLN